MHRKTIFVCLMAVCLLASVSTFAADGNKTNVKGMVISRTGEMLVVKAATGNVKVVLTDDTVTKDDRGLFGLEKQKLADVVLIPGLKVDVDGVADEQGRVVAKTITVDGDDLETAEMVQAGLHPTAQQVAANVQSIGANKQDIAANRDQLAAHKENIAANQQSIDTNRQNIAADQQQINENIKNITENTNRFTALSEY